jgi:transcriptional regulator with XRE-family HTH domain
MDYKLLGEKIRKERLRLSLTQEKLAEKVNISESYIGQIERAETKLSVETLVKLASELHVSIDYLLLESIKPEPNVILNEILAMLPNKNNKQLTAFLKIARVLAKNADDWT